VVPFRSSPATRSSRSPAFEEYETRSSVIYELRIKNVLQKTPTASLFSAGIEASREFIAMRHPAFTNIFITYYCPAVHHKSRHSSNLSRLPARLPAPKAPTQMAIDDQRMDCPPPGSCSLEIGAGSSRTRKQGVQLGTRQQEGPLFPDRKIHPIRRRPPTTVS